LPAANNPAELFRHVSAEKTVLYRRIMDVFAAAKRQYRLQLRADEVLAEAQWLDTPPRIEEVNAALTQLADWGNLQSQPDTARASTLSDFYRAKFLYRLSLGGEAVDGGDGTQPDKLLVVLQEAADTHDFRRCDFKRQFAEFVRAAAQCVGVKRFDTCGNRMLFQIFG